MFAYMWILAIKSMVTKLQFIEPQNVNIDWRTTRENWILLGEGNGTECCGCTQRLIDSLTGSGSN